MSCVSQNIQPFRFVVSMGQLPEGFCGTPQELAQAIADRLIIQSDQNFSSFAVGPNAPTSNVGPWLKDCSTWYVWDDSVGAYVPMAFPSLQAMTTPCGCITAWGGAIANIPAGWLFCDGAQYMISDYPCLYGAIGTSYGTPTCTGGFKVPDLRNKFIVGADADVANVAESTVTGAALKTGGTQSHSHVVYCNYGGNPSQGPGCSLQGNTTTDTQQHIPPFEAMAWIIKT